MPETTIPTCYRHADRETRLSCSQCGRPVCVECVRTAAVGQKCLECAPAKADQRVITSSQLYGGTLMQRAPVTVLTIAVCVVVFVLQQASPAVTNQLVQYNPAIAQGQWWRILTAALLHGSFVHIAFNMYALYLFGPALERGIGRWPFLALYVASAAAGGAAYFAYDVLFASGGGAAVGASGAIFGLFGAAVAGALSQRGTPAGDASLRQLGLLLALNLGLAFVFRNIAWQAHVGGLVAGFALGMLFLRLHGRQAMALRVAAGVAVTVVSVVAVLVL